MASDDSGADTDDLGPEYAPPEELSKEDLKFTAALLAGLEEYLGISLKGFVLRALRGRVLVQGHVETKMIAQEIRNWLKNQKGIVEVEDFLTVRGDLADQDD